MFDALARPEPMPLRVVFQIEKMIVDGRLKPGDRLPAERELGRQLGVSRTVIREAVAALAARGLLEPDPAGGSLVRVPGADHVAKSVSFFLRGCRGALDYAPVHEVRSVLEVEIAGLAAERRSDADLQAMDALVQEARNGLANRDDFARNDVEFHAALARATGNPLFPLLLDAVADVLLEVRRTGYDVPGTPARALRHHADILQQVRLGDSEGARQAMRTHLSESWDTQSRAGNTPTPEPPY